MVGCNSGMNLLEVVNGGVHRVDGVTTPGGAEEGCE